MSNQNGGNVIHIIGGDEAMVSEPSQIPTLWEGSNVATYNSTYGGDGSMVSKPSQIPTVGSSSFVLVENDRSYKFRHCKAYHTEVGCPFGDNCIHIHDENVKVRKSLAVMRAPGSGGGYWNAAANGYGGPAAPLPVAKPSLATLPTVPLAAAATEKPPLAQRPLLVNTVSSATVKPLLWRTRLCSKWEYSGYCQFGSRCIFAHGEAELQRPGGRPVGEANQRVMVQNLAGNQRPMGQNLAAPSGPSAGHAVKAPAAGSGGSGQMSCPMQGPIPSRNAWKVPKKLIGIYADWIDDLE